MYEILKNNTRLDVVDKVKYTKVQRNGISCLCPADEADGVVIADSHIEPLAGVSIVEFNGPAKLASVTAEGAALAQASTNIPPATVGVLVEGFDEWQPDTLYPKQYTLIAYQGTVYFTRQASLTSSAVYPPGSPGTESLYGVRPVPDAVGVYPYVYNMGASAGMLVADGGVTYECTRAIDPVLYPPSQIPAHFKALEP